VSALLAVASFCDLKKFYTLSDHVHRYGGSHTIFLHHRGIISVSSPSDLRIVSRGTGGLRGLSDLLGQHC
jgi:hypothetical protein